jgi:formylglycine-generating enzyme required for sulfatase activity
MQDKATPWAIFTGAILFICCTVWAWYDRQADPAHFPFEPLIAALQALLGLVGFGLMGFGLYQRKEYINRRDTSVPRQAFVAGVLDKDFIRECIRKGDIEGALERLKQLPGGGDIAAEQESLWRSSKAEYEGQRIDFETYNRSMARINHAITEALKDDAVVYKTNPNLTFRPQYALFRVLFRRFRWLDRRKSYFKPLISPIESKNELLEKFRLFDVPYADDLPDRDALAIAMKGSRSDELEKALGKDIFFYFLKGIFEADKPYFVLILADSGIGKTTFLQKLFHDYACTYPACSLAFVYAGANTLADVRSIADPGNTVLFLDGIDEDAGIRENVALQLGAFSEWLLRFRKVVVTCRAQLFDKEHSWERLGGAVRPVRIRLRSPYTLSDGGKTIEMHLRRRFPARATAAIDLYRSNKSLFINPLLLSWFEVLLKAQGDRTQYQGLFEVYETIEQKTAQRESDVTQRDERVGSDYGDKMSRFSRLIAIDLYKRDQQQQNNDEDVRDLIALRADDALMRHIDAQSRSFLVREAGTDAFRFSHSSFKDYFLAKALLEQELREEDFPFQQYREVAAFYRGLCWKHRAGKTAKEFYDIPLHDDKALSTLGLHKNALQLIALWPNWALRATLIRLDAALGEAFRQRDPLRSHMAAWLKNRQTSRDKTHYIVQEYEAVQTMIQQKSQPGAPLTDYQQGFLEEYVYTVLCNTAARTANSLHLVTTPAQYTNLLPPALTETDFGRIMAALLDKNPVLEQQFCQLHTLVINGTGLTDLRFLQQRAHRMTTLQVLNLANNHLAADAAALKPLLRMPELTTLNLQDNTLPEPLQTLANDPDHNCLRLLREQLLMPPDMVLVPGGMFQMGQPDPKMYEYTLDGTPFDSGDEQPVHEVTISTLELAPYALTIGEFRVFVQETGYRTSAETDERGSRLYNAEKDDWYWTPGICWQHDAHGVLQPNDRHPVLHVSWFDAVAYCNWLSERCGLTPAYRVIQPDPADDDETSDTLPELQVEAIPGANGYRLPTEAEWEYAATYVREGEGRRPRNAMFGNGKDEIHPAEINFDSSERWKAKYSVVGPFRNRTVPVGSLNSPNYLGLHDLSGNVYEWCQDWYGPDYYKNSPTDNPKGPASGSSRVVRGGSWGDVPQYCRVAYRYDFAPGVRSGNIGFRLSRTR